MEQEIQKQQNDMLRCPICGYTKSIKRSKNPYCKCGAGMVEYQSYELRQRLKQEEARHSSQA